MKKMYFPKRVPEPKMMDKIEMEIFEKVTKENYKRWILPLIEDLLMATKVKEGSILDVGCGPGLLVKELAERSKKFLVTGVDISSDALQLARQNCKGLANAEVKKGSAYKLPFPDESFDVVVCKDSLHHFSSMERSLREMFRVTRGGGAVYIQDLRRDLPWYLLRRAIPPDTIFKKLQFYSARASYTKPEVKKILSKVAGGAYTVKTRIITKRTAENYKKLGVDLKQLRAGFQSRYIAVVKKP